ncbi:MAG: acryloyl-CoA reductase [Acidimicrobiales bacterium]
MRAFVISDTSGELTLGVGAAELAQRDETDVLVKVEYSSVNFKDAMVASSPSRVRRVETLVGGVDAAGTVRASLDESLSPGDRVVVLGGSLGVARDGGFAQYVYAPPRYNSVLPESLSTRDAMIVGTAGYTAMASVLALESHGLEAGAEVLVTGATGGVGSQALTYLALKGYRPVASTGSPEAAQWLTERGATRVIGREDISDRPERVLGSELWDGAIDCVGGPTLASIVRSMRYGGAVAASGLVASPELVTTLYPFITRGVALIGVDAVEAAPTTREHVWRALGALAHRVDFSAFVDREISLEGLGDALEDIREGKTRGRILVKVL